MLAGKRLGMSGQLQTGGQLLHPLTSDFAVENDHTANRSISTLFGFTSQFDATTHEVFVTLRAFLTSLLLSIQ